GFSHWAVVGALAGLAGLMRPQDLFILMVPFLDIGSSILNFIRRREWKSLGRPFCAAALLVLSALVVFSPQAYAWKHMFGRWFVVPQGSNFMRWTHPNLDGVLFGSAGGLLIWTPILSASFLGLVAAPFVPKLRKIAGPLLLVVFVATYI